MPGVIRHARQALDEPRHPRQGPELRAEAVRPRPLAQGRFDAAQLLGCQAGLAPGPPRAAQRGTPAPSPRPVPSHNALATGAQPAGDGGLRLLGRGEEPRGLLPTTFQCLEIPSWCNMSMHAPIIRQSCSAVTVLCETQ